MDLPRPRIHGYAHAGMHDGTPSHGHVACCVCDETLCQDTDFSEKYELGLEEKSLRTFPRIS